jgi:hypothetical protein
MNAQSRYQVTDQDHYRRAQQRVREKKEFYVHLVVYAIVNGGLFLINILTTARFLWFYWPLVGWGIGLAIHAFNVFGVSNWLGKDWEEREIRKIIKREG